MSRRTWLAVGVWAGAAILGLSFLDAWIVHHRELTGEGYREVVSMVGAWRSVGLPVLALGIVAAVATAAVAIAILLGWRRAAPWMLPVGSVLALGLLGATLVPVAQDGHASSVDLSPGWAAFAGIGLAVLMAVAAVRVVRPGARHGLALAAFGFVAVVAGAGGRWALLQASAAAGEAWATGTYSRAAGGDQGVTLTVDDGRYRIGDRWEGSWESHSWTVILTDDPTCPGARGAYHAHNVGPDGADLRFVKVVDTCAEGERAADLETGIWERDP